MKKETKQPDYTVSCSVCGHTFDVFDSLINDWWVIHVVPGHTWPERLYYWWKRRKGRNAE